MTERKRLPPPSATHLPAASSTSTPSVALPSLPTSSGRVWGTRTSIMRADADFVRAHSNYLSARVEQTSQMRALIDARIALALKIAELATLPELVAHEYHKGRRDRAHEVAMQQLTHQTAEINAHIALAAAKQHLAAYEPQPPEPATQAATPPAAKGLTTAEVELAAQRLPEMTRETIETLLMMLSGMLAEKNK